MATSVKDDSWYPVTQLFERHGNQARRCLLESVTRHELRRRASMRRGRGGGAARSFGGAEDDRDEIAVVALQVERPQLGEGGEDLVEGERPAVHFEGQAEARARVCS